MKRTTGLSAILAIATTAPTWGVPQACSSPPAAPPVPAWGGPAVPGVGGALPGFPAPSTPGGEPILPGNATQTAETPAQLAYRDERAWYLWWIHNRESLLASAETQRVVTPRGDEARAGLAAELVHGRIVPALGAVLDDSSDPRLVREALLALGRLGADPRPVPQDGAEAPSAFSAFSVIEPFLGHSNRVLAEAAIVALGLNATPGALTLLAAIALDEPLGRKSIGTSRIDARRRAFACYALGLAAQRSERVELARFAGHYLVRAIDEADDDLDLQAAAVLGLGLVPSAGHPADADRFVRLLANVLEDDRAPRMARIHAPTAIARHLGAASLDLRIEVTRDLVSRVGPRSREMDEVRDSIVLALGLVGDSDDDPVDSEIRETLLVVVKKGEPLERRFAAVALAQVAGRPGTGDGEPLGAALEIERALTRELARGASRNKPWLAMSIGVLGKSLGREGRLLDRATADALFHETQAEKSPELASALGVGVSLVGDRRAAPTVAARFGSIQEDAARANLALALGMMGDAGAIAPLVDEMTDSVWRPSRFEHAARGRAMLGDDTLVADLVERLGESRNWAETSGCARALAWVGDAATLEPLLASLNDGSAAAAGRASVARALGWIGDAQGRPGESPLGPGLNYAAAPPTLTDPTETGILDML